MSLLWASKNILINSAEWLLNPNHLGKTKLKPKKKKKTNSQDYHLSSSSDLAPFQGLCIFNMYLKVAVTVYSYKPRIKL